MPGLNGYTVGRRSRRLMRFKSRQLQARIMRELNGHIVSTVLLVNTL